jgi:hypothetical protein
MLLRILLLKGGEEALLENEGDLKLEEEKDNREGEAQEVTEIICYKNGVHDDLELFKSK